MCRDGIVNQGDASLCQKVVSATLPLFWQAGFSLPHCTDQYQTYLKCHTWKKWWRQIQLPKVPPFGLKERI